MTGLSGRGLRAKYDFGWETLDVIISGKSSIDSPTGFQIQSAEEADLFIRSYGYDGDNPIENAELQGNFREALNFVRKHFLQPENPDGLKIEIPRRILELKDIRDLFLMASFRMPGQTQDAAGTQLRNWACSLLKIMHTIAHIDKDLRSSYFSDIQQQIFDRFYRVVHRDPENRLYLGERVDDPLRIDLTGFETKPKKSRDSIVLKLLHKPENVAEDIFDRVGVRFVTPTRLGALRVVKYLKGRMIIMPPNIKPSRSRNTLIDIEAFRSVLVELLGKAERGEIGEPALVEALETAARPSVTNPDNPHSSEFYRAIQFTCRQLIKLRNPIYDDLRELKSQVRERFGQAQVESPEALVAKVADRIDLKYVQREIRFFYPFEVQVLDQRSAEDNEKGRSAHSEYKKAQVQTALKRVMGSLMDAAR